MQNVGLVNFIKLNLTSLLKTGKENKYHPCRSETSASYINVKQEALKVLNVKVEVICINYVLVFFLSKWKQVNWKIFVGKKTDTCTQTEIYSEYVQLIY
jgi:hypothetical protein